MSAKNSIAVFILVGLVWAIGCGTSDDAASGNGGASMNELAARLDEPERQQSAEGQTAQAEQTPGIQPPPEGAPPGTAAESSQPAPPPPSEQPTTEPTTTVAGSATLGEGGGYYSAIAGARRHIVSRVESLAWTQAVQHFKAQEGRLPKDHAEFMSKVIAPLEIDLGYKEEDQEFLYDPSEGQWGTVYIVSKEEAPDQ